MFSANDVVQAVQKRDTVALATLMPTPAFQNFCEVILLSPIDERLWLCGIYKNYLEDQLDSYLMLNSFLGYFPDADSNAAFLKLLDKNKIKNLVADTAFDDDYDELKNIIKNPYLIHFLIPNGIKLVQYLIRLREHADQICLCLGSQFFTNNIKQHFLLVNILNIVSPKTGLAICKDLGHERMHELLDNTDTLFKILNPLQKDGALEFLAWYGLKNLREILQSGSALKSIIYIYDPQERQNITLENFIKDNFITFDSSHTLYQFLDLFANPEERATVLIALMDQNYLRQPDIYEGLGIYLQRIPDEMRKRFCGDKFIYMNLNNPLITLSFHLREVKNIYVKKQEDKGNYGINKHIADINRLIAYCEEKLAEFRNQQAGKSIAEIALLASRIFNEVVESLEELHLHEHKDWSDAWYRVGYGIFATVTPQDYAEHLKVDTYNHHYKSLLLVTLNLIYNQLDNELIPTKTLAYDRKALKTLAGDVATVRGYDFVTLRKKILQAIENAPVEIEMTNLNPGRSLSMSYN